MYPPPYTDPSNETLYKRYLAHIDVKLDKTGGISTLTAQAFDAEDALLLATELLKNAETLVNNLGARSRNDAISNAARQLNGARARVDEAQVKLTEFRNRERVVDPTRISNAVVETIARLSTEIAETKAQLAQLQQSAKRSPQLVSLSQKIIALENQVTLERQQLAGSDAGLAKKIAEYESLILEKEFSEKLLAAASNSVESARLDAQRQQVYLERIVSPALPDDPFGPKRGLTIVIIAVLCFFVFSTLRALFGRHRKMHKSSLGA
jgi:capsular polysaccharide transport system permease protein